MKKYLGLLFFTFLAVYNAHGQNWDKYALAIDEAYYQGDYLTAVKQNTKFAKKVTKKLGQNSAQYITYSLKAARNNLAQGLLKDFDLHIDKAIASSQNVYGPESVEHAKTLLDVANLQLQYGNFNRALSFVSNAESILGKFGEIPGNMKARIDFYKASIYSGQGSYADAIGFIDRHLDYYKGRAIDREAIVDQKSGKLKTTKLSDAEVFTRYGDYASLLNLKARTYWKQGAVNVADAEFEKTEQWIQDQRQLGRSSIYYVQNKLWHWEMLDEYGVDPKVARKNFEDALYQLKRAHTESHYIGLEIYEALLRNYLINNDEARYKNLRSEYEKVVKRYFPTNSVHEINLDLVEMGAKLDRSKTKNLESKTLALINNTRTLPTYHPIRIQLLEFVYDVAITDKKYINAEQYINDILEIKRVLYGDQSTEYHLSRLQLAGFYLAYTNKFEEAGQIFQESFFDNVSKQIEEKHVDHVEILNNLAVFYEGTDQYTKASETLDEALRVTRTVYDNQDYKYGAELEKIAGLQLKIGEYEKADQNLTEALVLLEKERRNSLTVIYYVKALETSAKLKAVRGELGDADDDIRRSDRMILRATNLTGYDELAQNVDLADLYILFGRYSDTKEILTEALVEYEQIYGGESRKLIPPLVSMGQLALTSGEFTEAIQYAERANRIATNIFGEESTKTAPTLILFAKIETALGDYSDAKENIDKAIAIQEGEFGREHIDVAKSLSTLGLIKLYDEDDPATIEPIYDEARAIIESKLGNTNPLYAQVLTELAEVYIAGNKHPEAFGILNQAFDIWGLSVDKKKNVNKAQILVLKGDVYYYLKNYAEAELNYNEAKKLYERFFNKNHPQYVKIISKLAKVHYMEGDSRRAKQNIDEALLNYSIFIKDYFPALSEREKARFWNTIRPDYEFYNTLAVELMDEFPKMIEEMMDNALSTKALLLNSSLKIRERIMNSNDDELIGKYNEWMRKKESLVVALSMSVTQLQENEIDPQALGAEVEEIEREISEKSELFAENVKEEITWKDVMLSLSPNEVAIEMVRFRYFDHIFTDSVIYAGMYVKNDGTQKAPELILIKDGYELESKYFKYYRNAIYFKQKDRFSYQKFWEPIVSQVGSFSTVYLSADGVYNQINLEAIPTGDDLYVIDNSNIILVSNTKDIYLNRVKQDKTVKNNVAKLFGNPTFYVSADAGKVGQLPGTEKEVEQLNDLLLNAGWDTSAYINAEATEAKVKELDNPKVFHIATHGFFDPLKEGGEKVGGQAEAQATQNPLLRTGVMLKGAGDLLNKTVHNFNIEDGILTAYEAMNLSFDNTDLVVLSACETGLGDVTAGEGVYGLQRAFIVAGAKTLIMSMFKVNDEATQKLMVNFYRKWLETGNKRQAFVDAKKELRNEFKEPIYWGAFIMIGLD